MPPITCAICSENASKYKCPRCLIRYCSLTCFKSHKESCSDDAPAQSQQGPDGTATSASSGMRPTSGAPSTAGNTSSRPSPDSEEDEDKDRVTAEQLQALGVSAPLRDMLHNHHLRDVLRGVDASASATVALKAAMQLPIFSEFADECLRVVAENGKADDLVYTAGQARPANPLQGLGLL
ncbi:zinc finger HIT domain-containing protein 3-like [Sycon ciliatum]|uniref:zinc finger HIT domain-containing protein 3-like n=1 Tax=Sycon ciliatum TaxID=27933 RepID=UPI0020AE4716